MRRDDDVSNFEDPALRSAIRRVWPGQAAPPELHRRLRDIAARSPGPATIAQLRWYRHPLFSLAAAAILLIAVGVLTMRLSSTAPPASPATPALPVSLADYLVFRHDACCKLPDHHEPGLPRDDLGAIAVVLKQKLGFPIMFGQPSAAPWRFDGASICQVGEVFGAHLIFKQPNQDISIFSLPLSLDPQAVDQHEFAMVEDGHPIVAFATKDAFYAVVGSSTDDSLSLASVTAMCNRLRPTVAPVEPQPSVAMTGWQGLPFLPTVTGK